MNAEPNPPDLAKVGDRLLRSDMGRVSEGQPTVREDLRLLLSYTEALVAALRECARRSGFMLHTPRRYVLKPGEVETEWTPDIEPFPHTENCFGCKLAALLPSPVQQEKP